MIRIKLIIQLKYNHFQARVESNHKLHVPVLIYFALQYSKKFYAITVLPGGVSIWEPANWF